ncbi:MAG: CopG family transcriptional regulator [Circular genetic element sp.]|nr:MAG: CopG family transcriptional regulator [Circular genetic element sp.]
MASKTVRITVSLPSQVVSNLDYISTTIGVSRSAFLSSLLSESLPPIVPLVQIVASASKDGDSKRFRGAAVSAINDAVSRLVSGSEVLQDDLFTK